jgi:hypothetical protein
MCSVNFKFLGPMDGNVLNNSVFFNFRNFCHGSRVLLFIALGIKIPSYATGTWPVCIEYHNKLRLICCMMYASSLNVCSSIDI